MDSFGLLQRRYAAGEITTEDYEQRKTRIERDLRDRESQHLWCLASPPQSHDLRQLHQEWRFPE